MKNHERSRALQIARILFVLCLSTTFSGTLTAQIRELPLDVFIGQLPATKVASYGDARRGNILNIDVYGKRNGLNNLGLPTVVTGKITAMDLGDGTERVTATIRTRDALCWGFHFSDSGSVAALFSYSPLSVQNHVGPAALGDSYLRIVFAPQPFGQFNPQGAYLESLMTTVHCDGLIRSGSGFAEVAPGFAQTTQVALFSVGTPTGCPAQGDSDCFPVENVQFKSTGH